MDSRKTLGNSGEAAVAEYLRRRHYRIMASQFRCRFGELDLVARAPDGTVCFVEVKSRTDNRFARAMESVTPAKQRRIRAAAQIYLVRSGADECLCRFDVAEVYPNENGDWRSPRINYVINAFT